MRLPAIDPHGCTQQTGARHGCTRTRIAQPRCPPHRQPLGPGPAPGRSPGSRVDRSWTGPGAAPSHGPLAREPQWRRRRLDSLTVAGAAPEWRRRSPRASPASRWTLACPTRPKPGHLKRGDCTSKAAAPAAAARRTPMGTHGVLLGWTCGSGCGHEMPAVTAGLRVARSPDAAPRTTAARHPLAQDPFRAGSCSQLSRGRSPGVPAPPRRCARSRAEARRRMVPVPHPARARARATAAHR